MSAREVHPLAPTFAALRRAGKKASTALIERDVTIVEAYENGLTLREIAEAVGLSAAGVLRIIRRVDQ